MASGGSNENDIFECAVCLNQMLDRTPRCLQCIHSFCEPCLEQMMRNQRITCPTCRKTTMVSTNSVKELPVNFMLHKMKDLQKAQQPQQQAHLKMCCQICKVATPDFKCNSCPRLMCAACKNEHDDVKEYKGHGVFDLCHQHEDSITHMCMKCITPLCMSCMAIDHKHHKGNFEDMSEAMKSITKEITVLKDSITEKVNNMNDFVENIQHLVKRNTDTEKDLLQRQQYYAKKMEEIDKLLKTTNTNKKIFKNIEEGCERTRNECEKVVASLDDLTKDKTGFCTKYRQFKEKAEDAKGSIRAATEQMIDQHDLPVIELNEHIETELVKSVKKADANLTIKPQHKKSVHTEYTEVKDLKFDKLLLDIPRSGKMNCQEEIDFIVSDVVMPNYTAGSYHAIRLNQQGRVVDRYYPSVTEERVNGVAVNEDNIYIVQDEAITVISSINKRTIAVYKPKIKGNMGKILVRDSLIYISTKNGCIYQYDRNYDKIKLLVHGLNEPTYINMVKHLYGNKFIVTEWNAHCIRVYNENWKYLYKFGSQGSSDTQFNHPRATAVTPMLTLLVADNSNHRICHYTMEGKLLSIVLDMGGTPPQGIAYKHPILWVCNGAVKSFQLK